MIFCVSQKSHLVCVRDYVSIRFFVVSRLCWVLNVVVFVLGECMRAECLWALCFGACDVWGFGLFSRLWGLCVILQNAWREGVACMFLCEGCCWCFFFVCHRRRVQTLCRGMETSGIERVSAIRGNVLSFSPEPSYLGGYVL